MGGFGKDKSLPPTGVNEPDLYLDAWDRFRQAVHVMAKAGPQHRIDGAGVKSGLKHKLKANSKPDPGVPNVNITPDDLIEIHEILVDWFAASEDPVAPPGVRDFNLLASAVARPTQTIGNIDAYPTIFTKAASLFHSLVNNHAFHNGNKRIALIAAQVVLAQENHWLDHSSDDEMFEFTRRASTHELTPERVDELPYISEWFEANSRRVIKGEHPLKFGELKEALKRFDLELGSADGEFVDIYKNGEKVERIIKQGIKGFRPYHTDYIAGVRKRLDLTPEHGVDSAQFYGHKGVANSASQFIELRIEVIRRLAKT